MDSISRYLNAVARLTLFVQRDVKATEDQLDEWQDALVELLERVNDERPNAEPPLTE